jgi:putative polyketide hydroxylase
VTTSDSEVTAVVRDRNTGDETTVHAQYLVAADGARSPVRRQLGIDMDGHGTFSDSITIYFKGDIRSSSATATSASSTW